MAYPSNLLYSLPKQSTAMTTELTIACDLPPLSEWTEDEVVLEQSRLFIDKAMHSVMDLIDVPLMILNQTRQTVFVNKRLQTLLGADSPGNLLGRRPGDLFNCVHSLETSGGCGTSETCALCGARESVLLGLGGEEVTTECRVLGSDCGRIKAYDLAVTSKPMMQNGERFAIVTLKDISDQKRRRALERIFFHDVLNSAGGLMGHAELLAERADSFLKDDLRMFHRRSEQVVEEIKAQKLLMDAESRELKIRTEPLVSMRLLESVKQFYERLSIARGRRIEILGDSDELLFESDPTLLRRVLGNMVKNALEAVKEGRTVSLCCKNASGLPVFSVNNPGVIDKRARTQIFMRHFSTKGVGRGLGAYSIKLLGEDYLGGKVWFESNEDQGTTFSLQLPARAPSR